MTLAVVFAGQGSQRAGMGADFHRDHAVARRTFAEASSATDIDIAAMCFGTDERLHLTEFTQPCLLTLQVAVYRVLINEFGVDAAVFGGHSLGEYTALVAAGAIDLADAVRLVRTRGALMQEAVPEGRGTMAALVLDDIAASGAVEIVTEAGADVANINSTAQLVISGTTSSIEAARSSLADALPGLTFIPLKVSAPFHSALMRPVEEEFRRHLDELAPQLRAERAAAVTSNRTGDFHDPTALIDTLAGQVSAPVRWVDNMRVLAARADRVLEIGAGAPLAAFFRTVGVDVTPVTTTAQAQALAPRRSAATSRSETQAQQLGAADFRRVHDARLAYAVGGLWLGITSADMVVRLGRAGLLGYIGTAGLRTAEVERAIRQVQSELPDTAPYGVQLCHCPHDPHGEAKLVDLLLRLGIRRVEACGHVRPSRALVRFRLAGLGTHGPPTTILARVASADAGAAFLAPADEGLVRGLLDDGLVTAQQARLGAEHPVADDVCADVSAAGGGPSTFSLLPELVRLRGMHQSPARIGLAGGLGTPAAIAAAFTLGADFVVTDTINQCTPQAGTSELVKEMLADVGVDDFSTAPAADRFELGAQVAVLRRGVLFAARARTLHDLYLHHRSVDELDARMRDELQTRYFGADLDDVCPATSEPDGRRRMALLLRRYLTDTIRRARDGAASDRLNFQVHGGAEIGALNGALRGTDLHDWRTRDADQLAHWLMAGAARLLPH